MRKDRILYIMIMSVLCFLITGRPVRAAEKTERQVAIVEVPQNLNFYLDPYNEKGKGQIYSEQYMIRNDGKEAVTFSIEMALSVLESETEIAFCPEEWNEEPAGRSIYMYVLFKGKQIENQYILTDPETSCKESVVLEPAGEDGDTVYISFGGTLSQSRDWKSGELAIDSLYNMSSASMGYMASVEGEHIRIGDDGNELGSGKSAELYLIPEEGYFLPSKVQVFMGGVETEAIYDAVTGRVFVENVKNDVVIYANGITRAGLPDAEVLNPEEVLWTWMAEEGIQAYEYNFLYEEDTVKSGRVDVIDSAVNWDWSEGLESGEYQLLLKAIGDTVHCLNSEEVSYQITVDREILQPSEEEEKKEPSDESGVQETDKPTDGSVVQETDKPTDGSVAQETDEPTDGSVVQETDEPTDGGGEQETDEPTDGGVVQETDEPTDGSGEQETDEPTDGSVVQETDEPTDGSGEQETDEPTDGSGEQETDEPTDGSGEPAQLSEIIQKEESMPASDGNGEAETEQSSEGGEMSEQS